jgi:putative phosphoesterase
MRLGIVSDLHGNAAGLAAALEHMGPVDELWCAGDIVNQASFSNEIVELLVGCGARCVLGNHDTVLLSAQGERARRAAHVRADLVEHLAGLPYAVEHEVDGKRLLMTHATPFPPHSEYVWPHSKELQRMAELQVDYLVLGHTHEPMAVQVGPVLVVNPGSAGQPTNRGDGPRLAYATLDTASGEVRLESFPCPPPRTRRAA